MAYSADFRNKVVQLYNSGTSTADLCAQFHISRSILYQWSEEAKVSNISKRDLATLQRHVATLENENSIYQKSLAALDLSIDNKVQIIDALKSEYSFYTLCRLLNLSRNMYRILNYAHRMVKLVMIDMETDALCIYPNRMF